MLLLTEPAGPKPLPFSSRQAPASRKQPARKSCGNTCTRIAGPKITAQLNFSTLKNKKVRQAGTITNNMVIHIRFYGLVPVVATPIYPASKAWLTRLRIRGCVWGQYGARIAAVKELLNHDGLRIFNNAGPDGPELTTKLPIDHKADGTPCTPNLAGHA